MTSHESRTGRPRGARSFVAAAIATCVGLVGLAAPASAHRQDHGGKWSNSSYSYYMNLNGHTWYGDNVIRPAAGNWGQHTRFNIGEGSPMSAPVSVSVNTYSGSWYGYAEPGPNQTCCTYTYGYVKVNHRLTKDISKRHKKTTTVHEMGHVIGLSHNDRKSIMNRSANDLFNGYDIVNPQDHDRSDVNNIYPN